MTLKEWFQKFQIRPLKIAAVFLLLVWTIFAYRSYLSLEFKQNAFTRHTADLLSLAISQKNRVGAESLLESLIHQGEAVSAELCSGDKQEMAANANLDGCLKQAVSFERIVEQNIQGSRHLVLKTTFNTLSGMSSMFSVLAFCLLLVLMGFYLIQTAQNRMKKDLFDPIVNKLLGEEELEIKELSALRFKIIESKRIEAAQAVTLAIQENNKQVAHDVRSPVDSISELLKRIEIEDPSIRKALEIAIGRANSIANSLLSSDVKTVEIEKMTTYDVAEVLQNIAAEKMPLFSGGQIEVETPKHLYVSSALSANSLARILSNLLDNALLACDHNKNIKIALRREASEVSIEISDTGRGMPAEIINRIGEKGFSVREKYQAAGSGLGVYSAKNILDKIGGNIHFESSLGVGTQVILRVPIKTSEPVSDVDVCLVENEKMNQMMWEIGASSLGLKCKIFSSIDELLGTAESISKSVPIFLDSDLGQGIRGQDYAGVLREMGFQKIFLATSYIELHGTAIKHIDAVISKSFDSALKLLRAENIGVTGELC